MLVIFKKVTLHNFLSYGHSEIDLVNRHYCLVSGINKDPQDNAVSNGSGKSTFGSAICWALTGQTINGITTNVKNINVDEDLCYVELQFTIDNDEYVITRYRAPKTDLKIILNDKDISGKGIRESEAILERYLPDLTEQLIASIIILGQGLPCKFTGNTPSGRKDVLEKLSKSDFMIQDLKNRLQLRLNAVNADIRKLEDAILANTANKNLLDTQIEAQTHIVEDLHKPHDFETQCDFYSNLISKTDSEITEIKKSIDIEESKNNKLNENYLENVKVKDASIIDENTQFNSSKDTYIGKKYSISSEINSLNRKIIELNKITDICPTCHQKIPNVIKPDTTEQVNQVNKLTEELNQLNHKFSEFEKIHASELGRIESEFSKNTLQTRDDIKKSLNTLDSYKKDLKVKQDNYLNYMAELNKNRLEKNNFEKNLENAEKTLYNLNSSVSKIKEEILYNTNEKLKAQEHLSTLNQLSILIKRDFRGFLLSNVIDFINTKAKEYSLEIFKTDKLSFSLNGNNIEISYYNKPFENLSGGEKQRVDLIIQFAIRDMMRQYLNFSSNILILDEIFDQLDAISVNAVLNCICNKLIDVESLFIISHRAQELEIPYDCEMVVTKDSNGVSTANWQ